MVLEETLIICGQFDLPEVTRAFKEADIQVRTTQTIALESLVSAKGAIKDIRTLLEDEIERMRGSPTKISPTKISPTRSTRMRIPNPEICMTLTSMW